jgi:hypothetical protein
MIRRRVIGMVGVLGAAATYVAYKQLDRPRLVWYWYCSRPYLAPTDSSGDMCFEPTNATHHKGPFWNQYIKHARGTFSSIRFQPEPSKLLDPTRGPWNALWRLEVWPSRIDVWRGVPMNIKHAEGGFIVVSAEDINTRDEKKNVATQVNAIDSVIVKHCPPPIWSYVNADANANPPVATT